MSQRESLPRLESREWTKRLAREASPVEVAGCLSDLLDRAEFAEEIARRQILERLVAALNETPIRDLSADTREILMELEALRMGGSGAF